MQAEKLLELLEDISEEMIEEIREEQLIIPNRYFTTDSTDHIYYYDTDAGELYTININNATGSVLNVEYNNSGVVLSGIPEGATISMRTRTDSTL